MPACGCLASTSMFEGLFAILSAADDQGTYCEGRTYVSISRKRLTPCDLHYSFQLFIMARVKIA